MLNSNLEVVLIAKRPLTPAEKVAAIIEAKAKAEEVARKEDEKKAMEEAEEQARVAAEAIAKAVQLAADQQAARLAASLKDAQILAQLRIRNSSKTRQDTLNAVLPRSAVKNMGA